MKNCIHCNSNSLTKWSKYKGFKQYRCNDCNKIFTEISNPKRNLIINDEKYCTTCKKFKPLSEFFYYKGRPRSKCKICFNKTNNYRYKAHNLNEDKFNEMLNNQNNKCAICHKEFKSNRHTFIDHDHITGNLRKLLCPKCNHLLGSCNDDIEILKYAILYLKEFQ